MTGEEEQIGGFDLIYRNGKRVKNGMKNVSFLGCLNNRMQQMPGMAKKVALRLADKAKEDKANELKAQQKNQGNKNIRNKSTNMPPNNMNLHKAVSMGAGNPSPSNPPSSSMNKSGNGGRRPVDSGMVKLPKVNTIGNSSVSNTSMKAIWEGGGKRSGHEGGSKEERRK